MAGIGPISASQPTRAGSVVAKAALEPPTVRIATAKDVPLLADALADAFLTDPVFTWMVPGTLRLRARLRALFTAEMEQYGLPQGAVWTNVGCDGAVVTLSPDAWKMPESITLAQGLLWARALGRRLRLAARVQRAMEEHHLKEPHLYVRIVGVRAQLQGRGLGSALMKPTLEQADSAGLPAYIEASTERSASLYERLGFVHLGALALPDNGPPIWPMRRPPNVPMTGSRPVE